MRFTPTAFYGSQLGQTLVATLSGAGATSGSFTSGGINYGYIKFTSGSYTLNVTTGAEIDMLIVGGGAGGSVISAQGSKGGGGGGVYTTTTRLYKGSYSVLVGAGGSVNNNGISSSISAYGYNYYAEGGNSTGEQGIPIGYPAGMDGPVCSGGLDFGHGGGGGAAASGSNGFCSGANVGQGGAGGEGLTYNFDGTPSVYGSGGGGGGGILVGGNGGAGGTNAGNGGGFSTGPTNAINGYGGGGGGEASTNTGGAGTGGHGIVIIRYRL